MKYFESDQWLDTVSQELEFEVEEALEFEEDVSGVEFIRLFFGAPIAGFLRSTHIEAQARMLAVIPLKVQKKVII